MQSSPHFFGCDYATTRCQGGSYCHIREHSPSPGQNNYYLSDDRDRLQINHLNHFGNHLAGFSQKIRLFFGNDPIRL